LASIFNTPPPPPKQKVDDLSKVASDVDVLYMTRIQKERFSDMEQYKQVRAMRVRACVPVRCRRAGSAASHHTHALARPPRGRAAPRSCCACCVAPRTPCAATRRTRLAPPRAAHDDRAQARGKYIINADTMRQLPKSAVVLHPLPRVDEVRCVWARARARVFADWYRGSALLVVVVVVVPGRA
jgi:aspartate carbamoyltransferase catalytic subunit